jgi:hypothetical protein
MKRKESKWIIEDTKKSSIHIEETNPHAVAGEQTKKNTAKRKGETKLPGGGKSNDTEQEPERKRKKKQNKTKKTKKMQAVQKSDENKEKCISYLKRWHEDRQNWKFEKLRQIWLLRNMLDPLKVSRKILL